MPFFTDITFDRAIALYLAIQSKYLQNLAKLKQWAENIIIEVDKPSLLILDIYGCQSLEEVSTLLALATHKTSQENWQKIDCTAIYLGFLYLRFQRKEIDFLTLILLCGRKTDLGNYRIDCSYFYTLANEIEKTNVSRSRIQEIEREIGIILQPMSELSLSILPIDPL